MITGKKVASDLWDLVQVSIDAAVLAEREACAKVCEDSADDLSEGDWDSACINCANLIRARGQA